MSEDGQKSVFRSNPFLKADLKRISEKRAEVIASKVGTSASTASTPAQAVVTNTAGRGGLSQKAMEAAAHRRKSLSPGPVVASKLSSNPFMARDSAASSPQKSLPIPGEETAIPTPPHASARGAPARGPPGPVPPARGPPGPAPPARKSPGPVPPARGPPGPAPPARKSPGPVPPARGPPGPVPPARGSPVPSARKSPGPDHPARGSPVPPTRKSSGPVPPARGPSARGSPGPVPPGPIPPARGPAHDPSGGLSTAPAVGSIPFREPTRGSTTDPALSHVPHKDNPSSLGESKDQAYERYTKMKRMNLPDIAIRNKMRADGVLTLDEQDLYFRGDHQDDTPQSPTNLTSAVASRPRMSVSRTLPLKKTFLGDVDHGEVQEVHSGTTSIPLHEGMKKEEAAAKADHEAKKDSHLAAVGGIFTHGSSALSAGRGRGGRGGREGRGNFEADMRSSEHDDHIRNHGHPQTSGAPPMELAAVDNHVLPDPVADDLEDVIGPEAEAEPQPEPQVESEPKPRGKSEPEPQVESEPKPQVESEPEPQGESETEPQAEPEPELEPQVEPELGSDAMISHEVEVKSVVQKLEAGPEHTQRDGIDPGLESPRGAEDRALELEQAQAIESTQVQSEPQPLPDEVRNRVGDAEAAAALEESVSLAPIKSDMHVATEVDASGAETATSLSRLRFSTKSGGTSNWNHSLHDEFSVARESLKKLSEEFSKANEESLSQKIKESQKAVEQSIQKALKSWTVKVADNAEHRVNRTLAGMAGINLSSNSDDTASFVSSLNDVRMNQKAIYEELVCAHEKQVSELKAEMIAEREANTRLQRQFEKTLSQKYDNFVESLNEKVHAANERKLSMAMDYVERSARQDSEKVILMHQQSSKASSEASQRFKSIVTELHKAWEEEESLRSANLQQQQQSHYQAVLRHMEEQLEISLRSQSEADKQWLEDLEERNKTNAEILVKFEAKCKKVYDARFQNYVLKTNRRFKEYEDHFLELGQKYETEKLSYESKLNRMKSSLSQWKLEYQGELKRQYDDAIEVMESRYNEEIDRLLSEVQEARGQASEAATAMAEEHAELLRIRMFHDVQSEQLQENTDGRNISMLCSDLKKSWERANVSPDARVDMLQELINECPITPAFLTAYDELSNKLKARIPISELIGKHKYIDFKFQQMTKQGKGLTSEGQALATQRNELQEKIDTAVAGYEVRWGQKFLQ